MNHGHSHGGMTTAGLPTVSSTMMMNMSHAMHNHSVPAGTGVHTVNCGGMMNMTGSPNVNCTNPTGGHAGMSMQHSMYFHFGVSETILFKGWETTSEGGLLSSMLAVAFLAFLLELLRVLRQRLTWKMAKKLRSRDSPVKRSIKKDANPASAWSSEKQSTGSSDSNSSTSVSIGSYRWFLCLQALLKMAHFTCGYLLMLVVMTYNVWLLFAVIIGFGIGYATLYTRSKAYSALSVSPASSTSSRRGLTTVTSVELEDQPSVPPTTTDHMY